MRRRGVSPPLKNQAFDLNHQCLDRIAGLVHFGVRRPGGYQSPSRPVALETWVERAAKEKDVDLQAGAAKAHPPRVCIPQMGEESHPQAWKETHPRTA
jgi:hypothetical protein